MTDSPRSLETLLAQGGHFVDPGTGAIVPPIHPSTTYARDERYELIGYGYSRSGNPTGAHVEAVLAELEGAEEALVFASGLAGIATFFDTVRTGGRVVAPRVMYHGAADWLRRLAERREVRSLASPAGDQHHGALRPDPFDRRHRRPDVRPLGIVDPANPPVHGNHLAPVRQAREPFHRAHHGADPEPDRIAQSERGEHVGDVVHARQRHRPHRHDGLAVSHDPRQVPMSFDVPVRTGTVAHAESDPPAPIAAKRRRQRIVEIRDHHRVACERTAFRRDVGVQVLVAIHVIGADVQHRGRHRAQGAGRLELEARKLENVELVAASEQGERRWTEVASTAGPDPVAPRHGRHQRGHRALPVRAGDCDHRRVGRTREQLDVADDWNAARRRRLQCGLPYRYAGAHDDLGRGIERGCFEVTAADLDLGELRLDFGPAGRMPTRVHRDDPPPRVARATRAIRATEISEMAHARQPGRSQSDHQYVPGRRHGARPAEADGVDGVMRVHAAVTES